MDIHCSSVDAYLLSEKESVTVSLQNDFVSCFVFCLGFMTRITGSEKSIVIVLVDFLDYVCGDYRIVGIDAVKFL